MSKKGENMSAETLLNGSENIQDERSVELAPAVGETVFALLAEDAETATTQPSELGEYDYSQFTNSVTRLGDGQTVPDER